jgi:hypothetical protein
MKKILLLLTICVLALGSFAYATESNGGYCNADGTCYDDQGHQIHKNNDQKAANNGYYCYGNNGRRGMWSLLQSLNF